GFFPAMLNNDTLAFLAELGSILLLFEIGLESSLQEIHQAGKHASLVALIGVLLPFTLGYLFTPWLFNNTHANLALFIGSMLAVTSTGISVSVFKDLGIIKHKACQIVLAASVIDDIVGLVLLSLVSGLIISHSISLAGIAITLGKVSLFFIISFSFGTLILPKLINKFIQPISRTQEMLLLTLITFCLLISWFAHSIGLASIIGAFVAGVLLDDKLFKGFATSSFEPVTPLENHLAHLIAPLGKILTPIFFIYAGMQVDIIAALNFETLKLAGLISLLAILSKACCGCFLPKPINKWLVGFGMVPRGEIGIIFALTGLELKIINHEVFAALLLMVVITSVVTPLALTKISHSLK
ncbi:MAG: cation:proton antiporter, partial [Burkholderiales bacterium]